MAAAAERQHIPQTPTLASAIRAALLRARSGTRPILRHSLQGGFRIGVAACGGALLLLVWGAVALHLWFDRAQTMAQGARNVANLSRITDEYLTRRIYEIDQVLQVVRQEYAKSAGNFGPVTAIPRNLGRRDGTVLVRVIQISAAAVPGAIGGPDRDILAAHLTPAADRVVIGRPVQTASGSGTHWEIPISRRMNHPDGSLAGAVLVNVSPEFLSAIFDKVNLGDGGFIAIIGKDDLVVRACTTEAGVTVPCEDLKNTPLPAALARAPAGAFVDSSPTNQTERIIGYRVLDDYPLVIAIGASRPEFFGRYNARRLWLTVSAGALSILICGVAVLLVRQHGRRRNAEASLQRQALELDAARREAEQANAAAQTANHAKSEFLANMSHELRTPLNAILGFSEMMAMPGYRLPEERSRDYAQSIHTAGSHLLKIINDILDLSKIEAGRFELSDEEVVLDELFQGCRRFVAERAANGGLTLECRSNGIRLRADPLRLRQMLLNLLSNAVKFTPAGGRITVTATQDGAGEIAISVRDTGVGIKPEDFAKVLEPFGQVSDTSMRAKEGTGLGLPLVRRLAELHGGQMRLESRHGYGTTIILFFPAARAISRAQEAVAAE